MPPKLTRLVLSALGKDKPGIIDRLSKPIFELGCNIADSRMVVLGDEFAIMLMVEGQWNQLAKLEDQIGELEKQLGLTIITARSDQRDQASNLLPYAVDVVAMDHPGIVYNLAGFFAQRGINIEEMSTSSYAAAHTGTPMFAVHMSVGIPGDTHIGTLRDEFMDFCDSMNLDAALESIRG